MRRWITVAVVVFAVLDLVVLAVGYRARGGLLPSWQVAQPRFSMQPEGATDTSSVAPDDAIAGPVLMAVDADGLLVRATRGACQVRFDNPARVAVGSVRSGEGVTTVDVPDVVEVLGVSVLPDGHVRVSGLDDACTPVTVDSTDNGQTWNRLAAAGIWRLDMDTTADHVTGPGGAIVPVGCVPDQLLNLPGTRALTSCTTGGFSVLATTAKPVPLSAIGYTGLSAAIGSEPGEFYVFGTTSDCGAQVGSLSRSRTAITKLECLGSLQQPLPPLAIASAGDLVVIQVGDHLEASEDGGQNFEDVV